MNANSVVKYFIWPEFVLMFISTMAVAASKRERKISTENDQWENAQKRLAESKNYDVHPIPIKSNCKSAKYEEPFQIEFKIGTVSRNKFEHNRTNCHGFFLCYESFLDSQNRRVRPQFWVDNLPGSIVGQICQKNAGPGIGMKPIWHGIGLEICIEFELKSMHWIYNLSLHNSITKRIYGPVKIKYPPYWKILEWPEEPFFILRFETHLDRSASNGVQLPMELTLICLYKTCSDRIGNPNRNPAFAPDLDNLNMKSDYKLWNGENMFKSKPGLWFLPIDIATDDGKFNFKFIYPAIFRVKVKYNMGVDRSRDDPVVKICDQNNGHHNDECWNE